MITSDQWPIGMPPTKPGPVHINGRTVYWTGKLAIGIRHQPSPDYEKPVPSSQLWVQRALLDHKEH